MSTMHVGTVPAGCANKGEAMSNNKNTDNEVILIIEEYKLRYHKVGPDFDFTHLTNEITDSYGNTYYYVGTQDGFPYYRIKA